MNLKILLLLISTCWFGLSKAQQIDSLLLMTDTLTIDSDYSLKSRSANFNQLPEPILFILNEKLLSITKFSELNAEGVTSIKIIRKKSVITALGYGKYGSVVIIKTKEAE